MFYPDFFLYYIYNSLTDNWSGAYFQNFGHPRNYRINNDFIISNWTVNLITCYFSFLTAL